MGAPYTNPKLQVSYLPIDQNFSTIINQLQDQVAPDDLILLLGAGQVNKIAKILT